MENDKFPDAKEITDAQKKLIFNLLQSRVFSKKEFEVYMRFRKNSIKKSYEAGLLIECLLKLIRFRKKFYTSKQKAHLKCWNCSGKKELTRLYSPQFDKQIVICKPCKEERARNMEKIANLPREVEEADLKVKEAIANHPLNQRRENATS